MKSEDLAPLVAAHLTAVTEAMTAAVRLAEEGGPIAEAYHALDEADLTYAKLRLAIASELRHVAVPRG